MSSSHRKTGKKETKQLSVATRCVAIVFKRTDTENTVGENGAVIDEKLHVELLHAEYREKEKRDVNEVSNDTFNAKDVLDEFKFRNKTCYWNPALVESIRSLEYVGFIEPLTILVKGDDIHLENVRTAWGRRVLKDPTNYTIERIGDVNGIEMQVVPQTQFIPLPEALCLVIMDLNNRQIVATLETVCEKLRDCYHGLHLPSNQLVYETLGSLIRERKVFHTGCGYFVVTPDTFRFNGNEMQSPMFAPWTHLHPMYIPAAFGQPFRQPTRSISCQVDAEDNLIGPTESCDKPESNQSNKDTKMKDTPTLRTQRSMSFSVRRPRDRNKKEDEVHYGSLKRSSSVRGRNEKENKHLTSDTISEPVVKGEKLKKEKVSIFSKLFGRNKKKPVPEPKKPAVEYASFSAQFPPPEWMWYQQQLDKQVRTETWVQQQIVKSGTWHHLTSLPTELGPGSYILGTSSAPDRSSPLAHNIENVNHDFVPSGKQRPHKKSHRNKANRSPLIIANNPSEGGSPLDYGDYQTHRNSMGQPSIRLSSLPTRLSQTGDMVHSNFTSHPMFSSTPRVATIPERYKTSEADYQQTGDTKQGKNDKAKTNSSSKKTPKSRKSKSHQSNRHTHNDPGSRHISGMSVDPHLQGPIRHEDISMQYHGQMPEKYSSLGQSRSSGVNCMDFENDEGHYKTQRSQRPRSYRQSYSEYHHGSRGHFEGVELLYENANTCQMANEEPYRRQSDTVNAHIYANVHVTNKEDVKPKLPERTHRKTHKGRNKDLKSQETLAKQTVSDDYRLGHEREHDIEHSHGQGHDRLAYHGQKQEQVFHHREHNRLGQDGGHCQLGRGGQEHENEYGRLVEHENQFGRLVIDDNEHDGLGCHERLILHERGLDRNSDCLSTSRVCRISEQGERDADRNSEDNSEQGTVQSSSSQEHGSQDSAIDGTESSEHSLGTVINTQSLVNKHIDKILTRTQDISLGDSGFNSPRVSENCSENKKCDYDFKKEQGFTCNNLKMEKNAMNNSLGKLDDVSDDSISCIRSDTLYENVKLHQREVLNNMKYLHKEINVSSQNLNQPQLSQEAPNGKGDYDPKQPVVKKFNFEGDFHVVGVV